jgi:hypothetical protein
MHYLKLRQKEKAFNTSLDILEYNINKAINTADHRGDLMFEVFERKGQVTTKGIDYCVAKNTESLIRIQNQFNSFREELDFFFAAQ